MIRSQLRRFRRSAAGASAVEFALVVTPFILLVFGVTEYGRLLWTRTAIQETAIATARCMGVKQTSCATTGAYSQSKTNTFIQSQAHSWSITIPNSAVALDQSTSCQGVSGFSRVAINVTFQTAVPILLGSLANGVALSAVACFPNQS